MKVTLVHPGTQHSFRLASELNDLGLLEEFITGIAFQDGPRASALPSILPSGLRKFYQHHRLPDATNFRLSTYILMSAYCLWMNRRSQRDYLTLRNEYVQRKAIKKFHKNKPGVVIGFDTSSSLLAKYCQENGVPLILDQSIAHERSKQLVYEGISKQYPEWAESLPKKSEEQIQSEAFEHNASDLIVVATTYSKNSLIENGVEENKIRVIPYGVDHDRFAPRKNDQKGSVRFVFVGGLSPRKGIHLLFEAWANLTNDEDAELWLIGPTTQEIASRVPDKLNVKMFGAISNEEVANLITQCDVLVFPSLCEGFGLVILEALATGLSVISTNATAAPDLYEGSGSGIVLEDISVHSLTDALSRYLREPERIRIERPINIDIAQRFTWKSYGAKWGQLLSEVAQL